VRKNAKRAKSVYVDGSVVAREKRIARRHDRAGVKKIATRRDDVFENEKVATLEKNTPYTEKERKKREETSVAFELERARVFGVRGEPRMTLQTFRGGRHGNLSRSLKKKRDATTRKKNQNQNKKTRGYVPKAGSPPPAPRLAS